MVSLKLDMTWKCLRISATEVFAHRISLNNFEIFATRNDNHTLVSVVITCLAKTKSVHIDAKNKYDNIK